MRSYKQVLLLTFLNLVMCGWCDAIEHKSSILYIPNLGQWHPNVKYQTAIKGGKLYVEKNRLIFQHVDMDPIVKMHTGDTSAFNNPPKWIYSHSYEVELVDANVNAPFICSNKSEQYYNYFLGNEKSQWAMGVYGYGNLLRPNVYKGIDFKLFSVHGQIKYDFIVAPGANPDHVKLKFQGQEGLFINEAGELVVQTSIGNMFEAPPIAYQRQDGLMVKVPCEYTLRNGVLGFKFPKGYDESKELVIDPIMSWSSFSGATAMNFGCTATYDQNGNLYGGGICYGVGYPVTTGAYQTAFGQGETDIAISKFSADGTSLIYSTYLGGTKAEMIQSMVVNSSGELYILGTTSSNNFPTTASAYDTSFNGGPSYFPSWGSGMGPDFLGGVDLVVCKFSVDGTALSASTYLGGKENDGVNIDSDLNYNYGDTFRGEIVLDANEDVAFTSCTFSSDFPTTAGAFQNNFGGKIDGCVVKLTSDLSSIIWSTFVGGDKPDVGFGMQFDSNGDALVSGASMSTTWKLNNGQQTNFAGGQISGYVVKLSGGNGSYSTGTFVGTPGDDLCFFVQVNKKDEVFVLGQTSGNYPMTANVYGTPNSGLFLHKFSNDLGTSLMSTCVGKGAGSPQIVPSAFLVSDCDYIYISGWGGNTNSLGFPGGGGDTYNMPTTADAFQSTTDGSDIYLMLLDKDATSLMYGSFIGGSNSADHVDGGTSRFDKNGYMYQSVCAACGVQDDFPTTSGSWSTTSGYLQCNMAVFKFNLASTNAVFAVTDVEVCINDSIKFSNSSSGGNTYHWDFGDGNTSSEFQPVHAYTDSALYVVTLIVSDSTGCLQPDTSSSVVKIKEGDFLVLNPDTIFCQGDTVQLLAQGGDKYHWSPGVWLNSDSIADPISFPDSSIVYTVYAQGYCGRDTGSVKLSFASDEAEAYGDTVICPGDQAVLTAEGGATYQWSGAAIVGGSAGQSIVVNPTADADYGVKITTINGCEILDTISITMYHDSVITICAGDTICPGGTFKLWARGGTDYLWSPSHGLSSITGSQLLAKPDSNTTYIVAVDQVCGTAFDSVTVIIERYKGIVFNDTVCPGDSAVLRAEGGQSILWILDQYSRQVDDSTLKTQVPWVPYDYEVQIESNRGCIDTTFATVHHHVEPFLNGPSLYSIFPGGQVQIVTGFDSSYSVLWAPRDYLSCSDCPNPISTPEEDITYMFRARNKFGCNTRGEIFIRQESAIFVPNTFTPNADGDNDEFYVSTLSISSFRLRIFDRWGLLVFESGDPEYMWDGTYLGEPVPQDTFVWVVNYGDHNNNQKTLKGYVNVLR